MSFLLSLLLAAPPEPTLFVIEDAEPASLQKAVQSVIEPDEGACLFTAQDLEAHLAGLKGERALGCADDTEACSDPDQAVLQAVGLAARITVKAQKSPNSAKSQAKYRVSMTKLPAHGALVQGEGSGATLKQATREALNQLKGNAFLDLHIAKDAIVIYDREVLGTGPGRYSVPAGKHKLRIEAKNQKPKAYDIDMKPGESTEVSLELGMVAGELEIDWSPAGGEATIDNQPYLAGDKLSLAPGKHKLRIQVPGYAVHEREVEVKPSTRCTQHVTLVPKEPEWRTALRTPDPDTLVHKSSIPVNIRLATIWDGPINQSFGSGENRIKVTKQTENQLMFGAEIGARYAFFENFFVKPLSLSFDEAAGSFSAKVNTQAGDLDAHVEDLKRLTMRFGWFGVRYLAWKLEPSLALGFAISHESGTLKMTGAKDQDLSDTSFQMGMEVGVKIHIVPNWFASVGFELDMWADQRPFTTITFGGGYSFDAPGLPR